MIFARIKNLVKRLINWWRRRRDIAARLSRLEYEVEALRNRIDSTSAFYERRLDAVLRATMVRNENIDAHSGQGSGSSKP